MAKRFRGVYAVTVTPFDAQGEVDEAALRRHVRWLLDEGGVHGIIPAGSTGEFAFLSEVERKRVAEIAIDEVDHSMPVIVGSAACATRDTIRYARMAQSLGADGVMVVAPYYGHLSQAELFVHFSTLAQSVDIPIMLYNNPGASGSDLMPETVARLAEFERIAAIKESSGIMQRVSEIQRLCGERVEVLCGCDTLPLEMFLMGVGAWVAAPANIVPRECVSLYELAVEQRDLPEDMPQALPRALALYHRLLPLFQLFENSGQYVQLNKAALEMMGRPVGKPRLPLMPPDEEMKRRLREILRECGLG